MTRETAAQTLHEVRDAMKINYFDDIGTDSFTGKEITNKNVLHTDKLKGRVQSWKIDNRLQNE